jgi:hypothetical protein
VILTVSNTLSISVSFSGTEFTKVADDLQIYYGQSSNLNASLPLDPLASGPVALRCSERVFMLSFVDVCGMS